MSGRKGDKHLRLVHHDLNSQISRMVAFIEHEAQERVEEIDCKTEGECCYEKSRLIHQARLEMQRVYDKKERAVLKQEQTERATLSNQARLRQLACREAHIARVEAEVQVRLMTRLADNKQYRELLYNLLVQGVCRLLERNVQVRVLERDVKLVEELFPQTREYYSREVGGQLRLSLDTSAHLPPSSLGGVELFIPSHRIRVVNTLHSRTQMIVRQLVPAIKHSLFDSFDKNQGVTH